MATKARVYDFTSTNTVEGLQSEISHAMGEYRSGRIDDAQMSEFIAAYSAALRSKAAPPQRGVTVKTARSGAVSVYGLQRMPVTLYAEQWERLFAHADAVRRHIKEDPPTPYPAGVGYGGESLPPVVAKIKRKGGG